MLAMPWQLKRLGISGINARNALLVAEHNPRRLYPLVDDKLRTKELAQARAIAVPKLHGVIEIEHQIRALGRRLEGLQDFVLKPAHGAGGEGILVVIGVRGELFIRANDENVSLAYLQQHASNILSGMYSLGGHPDQVMIEECVHVDPLFERVVYRGVPDIRMVVYRGIPIMAMARLPTRQSGGKANLHQGALGVGIDMATGTTLQGVLHERPVAIHPDTLESVAGIRIPGWDRLLVLAARCHEMSGLGYLGVDVVLDRDRGPLVLELNARPGLSIQIANRAGLLTRLARIEALGELPRAAEERATLGQALFGSGSA